MSKHIFKIKNANVNETEVDLVLSEAECTELATSFDLAKLSDCSAHFVIDQLEEGALFHVKMTIKAKAEIALPLGNDTLEIVIDDAEDDMFTTRKDLIATDDEEEADLYAPELITHGEIDLAEMMHDYLYLMIEEEFTRLTGGDCAEGEMEIEETRRPFSNLQELLDQKK